MYIYVAQHHRNSLPKFMALTQRVALHPGPGGSGMSDSFETHQVFRPHLGASLPPLNRPWQQARLVGLWPSQQIALHRDAPLAAGVARYHLPLQTNEGCWSYAGGVWAQLQAGSIYRLDPTEEHGAVNWGGEIRVHLMIDVKEG